MNKQAAVVVSCTILCSSIQWKMTCVAYRCKMAFHDGFWWPFIDALQSSLSATWEFWYLDMHSCLVSVSTVAQGVMRLIRALGYDYSVLNDYCLSLTCALDQLRSTDGIENKVRLDFKVLVLDLLIIMKWCNDWSSILCMVFTGISIACYAVAPSQLWQRCLVTVAQSLLSAVWKILLLGSVKLFQKFKRSHADWGHWMRGG